MPFEYAVEGARFLVVRAAEPKQRWPLEGAGRRWAAGRVGRKVVIVV